MSAVPNVLASGPRLIGSARPASATTAPTTSASAVISPITTTPSLLETPELCGFKDRTTPFLCDPGYTCMFNTDIYAAACCTNNACSWVTTCCGYARTATDLSVCGNGISSAVWLVAPFSHSLLLHLPHGEG